MLVRVFYSELEMLPAQFDEARHRTTSQLNFEAWAEYMTVWRKDRIELYEDYVRVLVICGHFFFTSISRPFQEKNG